MQRSVETICIKFRFALGKRREELIEIKRKAFRVFSRNTEKRGVQAVKNLTFEDNNTG